MIVLELENQGSFRKILSAITLRGQGKEMERHTALNIEGSQ
jgi:hypothetical protein